MFRTKRIMSVLLMVVMMISLLAGCGSRKEESIDNQTKGTSSSQSISKESEIDISEEVTLKMILLGSKPEDFDIVYEKVNEILKEKVNATLEVEFYDWGD